jgi:hypothetical protein
MDPNAPVPPSSDPNAGQAPPPPPPPAWGQPAPGQAPPPAPPPAWGQPAPGQVPPPGWGQPGQVPPPGWGAPAPRRGRRRLFLAILAVAVIVVGGFVVVAILNPSHRGEVVFASTTQTGNGNCKVTNQVSTIKSGDSVFIIVVWSHTMSQDETVVEEDFKDGVSLGTLTWDPTNYAGYDCSTGDHDFKDVFAAPGTYEIKLTVGSEVVADGKLTVTP